MKSSFDPKTDVGRITPENMDDLFLLKDIITPGSLVKSKTQRSIQVKRGDEKVKVGKRTVILTIIVDKVELSDKLRLGGRIAEAPEDIEKGHHTLGIEPGMYLEIKKDWKAWELNKIKIAKKKQEPVLICILDEREADLYEVGSKTSHLGHFSGGVGKSVEQKAPEYYSKIATELNKAEMKVIVAGPGFAKENLVKHLKIKIMTDSVSHSGEVGLQELINRGTIEKVVISSRITEETLIVEKLLAEIMKDGKAVYGVNETKSAIEVGAIEILLISDMKVREMEDLMELADKLKSKVMIISSRHQAGEKLLNLGGIAGLLRYKI
ncbi:MAG: mRNA surveillance protein pelota [Nanoarchaeota archaeon]|nr:mRNA surveillance protein pelota [Nanoarchaeota archaeon]